MRTKEIERTNQSVLKQLQLLLGDHLLYLGYFGSTTNGHQHPWSDVDYLIVARDLPKQHLIRDQISRKLKQLLLGSYPPVAFNFYTLQEIRHIVLERPWFNAFIINQIIELYNPKHIAIRTRAGRGRLSTFHSRYHAVVKKTNIRLTISRREECRYLQHQSRQALLTTNRLLNAKPLTKGEVVLALHRSLTNLLKALLIKRGVYIVKGEIVQLFISCFADRLSKPLIKHLLSVGLAIEQMAGRYNGLPLDFSQSGKRLVIMDKEIKPTDLSALMVAYKNMRKQLLAIR